MNSIIFLYAGFENNFAFDNIFDSKSAFERTIDWALSVPSVEKLVLGVNANTKQKVLSVLEKRSVKNYTLVQKEQWSLNTLMEALAELGSASVPQNIIYTSADRPFLDAELTSRITHDHETYLAEYTFSDGYPLGFSPEVLNVGTARILFNMVKDLEESLALAPITAESIFSLLNREINSFEVETVIAPKDYRMYRFDFSCGTKSSTEACKRLFFLAKEKDLTLNAENLSELACDSASVQRTFPAFYEVQICPSYEANTVYFPYNAESEKERKPMDIEHFTNLVQKIADFSENAVVSLSAWGEPLLLENISAYIEVVAKHKGLCVLIETDALSLSEKTVQAVALIQKNALPRSFAQYPLITWIVRLDAVTSGMYAKVRGIAQNEAESAFTAAKNAVAVLQENFPNAVYPQFTRMNLNEEELEGFYRYWHDVASPSKGKLIIQKYDCFCGLLADEKPSNLSPLTRNPCWHLKRDMVILSDGSVPHCKESVTKNIIGNVFSDGLEQVWQSLNFELEEQIKGTYAGQCGNCDEYYTFNF